MSGISLTRRKFIASTLNAVSAAAVAPSLLAQPAAELPKPTAARLPRWRGFNLLEKFNPQRNAKFVESDFAWMAEWGFNFARLPLSYPCWTDPKDWLVLKEEALREIDQAVEFGRKYRVHVNINFHRAPGYCVNPPKEPLDLWKDEEAVKAACHHWAAFAKRFQGRPNQEVSFDLLNEPADIPEQTYVRVVRRLVEAIRSQDADRLIVADGLRWGTRPVPSLVPLGLAQSTRGYEPMRISHYKASWVKSEGWAEPTWPLPLPGGEVMDKERLRQSRIEPWKDLQRQGSGVHVGEWGAYNRTPHAVTLAWMRDCLDLWKEAGWGWALWNFRGAFGILDSGRPDVNYENFRGHKLDRAMLELLRQY